MSEQTIPSDIKNPSLADEGKERIEWASSQMDVLKKIRERFEKEQPLKGSRIAACLHVTSETAVLMRTLKAGGAEVVLVASNPLSTQDDVAASLVTHDRVPVFAIREEDRDTYYAHLTRALDFQPTITMDDGADLVTLLHTKEKERAGTVWGSTEETTTGVHRLHAMEADGSLLFPAIAVNESKTKHLFDNRYGTGQSTIDGILRLTNVLLAGKTMVIAGYGWCGRGVASRARGMGANVIVTEVDPVRALEATMDGYGVMPMERAVREADLIVTLTGDRDVLDGRHFDVMKDGALICNSGHFDIEIDIGALTAASVSKRTVKPYVEEYRMKNGKNIFLLGGGRLVNLVGAEGHPPAVMDMSFANQAFAAEYIVKNHGTLERKVYVLPGHLDDEIARIKLASMGRSLDSLTNEQTTYLSSWQTGT